jgi:hypothetical protein
MFRSRKTTCAPLARVGPSVCADETIKMIRNSRKEDLSSVSMQMTAISMIKARKRQSV